MSVELPRAAGAAITMPLTAMMPTSEAGQGSVFVLDGNALQRRAVRVDPTLLAGGRIAVIEGLAVGERVVVAGTAYLSEGQAVTVYAPQTVLTEAAR